MNDDTTTAGKSGETRSAAGRNVTTVSRESGPGSGPSMDSCIDACSECHRLCLATAAQGLRAGGGLAEAAHISALLDCAAICATSADLLTRSSPLHPRSCALCAEACRVCAESCRQHADVDLRRCIEVCERCEASCASMAMQMNH